MPTRTARRPARIRTRRSPRAEIEPSFELGELVALLLDQDRQLKGASSQRAEGRILTGAPADKEKPELGNEGGDFRRHGATV